MGVIRGPGSDLLHFESGCGPLVEIAFDWHSTESTTLITKESNGIP